MRRGIKNVLKAVGGILLVLILVVSCGEGDNGGSEALRVRTGDLEVLEVKEYDGYKSIRVLEEPSATNNMTRKKLHMDAIDIIREEFKNKDIEKFDLFFNMELEKAQGEVMSISISRETFEAIDWDEMRREELPEVVERYGEHNVFED